ncbi:MAG: metallophosphoesterase [Thermoplasmatota archaeon]
MKSDVKSKVLAQIIWDEELDISEEEYKELVVKAKEEVEPDNVAVRDWGRYVVIGDIHGDLEAAEVPIEYALKKGLPMIFLGDYVDRGDKQLETLAFVLSLKLEKRDDVVLLRGNHETISLNRSYGFVNSLLERYSEDLYTEITELYDKMPISAVIDQDSFFVHGGIPEGKVDIEEVQRLEPSDKAYSEMLWNDPSEDTELFAPNHLRGGHHIFGKEAVDRFLSENELSMIFRAHQCFAKGYNFFFDERLLSIFSVPNYCENRLGKFAVVDGDEIELRDIQYDQNDSIPSF